MSRLFGTWQHLRHGLWFRPSLIASALVALGLLMPWVDDQGVLASWPLRLGAAPATARTLLATIAGSLMTVLALVFSLTLIAMQLVSSQLTPRALRGFLGATTTQTAAGMFVGTILYCFLAMRAVRGDTAGGANVPELSVTLGLGLGVVAMGLLLVFVHHIATWMHLSSITERIARATVDAIRDQFQPLDARRPPVTPTRTSRSLTVAAPRTGYVQYYTTEGPAPPQAGVGLLTIHVATGDFVEAGQPLLTAELDGEPADDLRESLQDLVVIGNERDISQDAAFGLRQLADIALRALSPGINDPTTAVGCIHYLTECLRELGRRRLGSQVRTRGRLVIRYPSPSLDEYLETAFEEIALFGAHQPRIMRELIRSLRSLESSLRAAGTHDRADRVRLLTDRVARHAVDRAPTEPHAEALRRLALGITEAVDRPSRTGRTSSPPRRHSNPPRRREASRSRAT